MKKTLLSYILLTVVAFAGIAQKKTDLTYNLELNKIYSAKNTSLQNTTQTVMGKEQSTQTQTTLVVSLKPLKQMKGEMIAEIKFDTIITLISMPQMEINSSRPGDLNSSDPGKIMECILHRMSNSTFLARMTNTGRVIGFMNLEPVTSEIMQGTDSIQGQSASFIMQRVKTMLEEKSLKSMVEAFTAYLPGSEVQTGDTWKINMNASGGGMDMTLNGDYKLEKLEKKSAMITGDITIESAPGTMEINGARITPDLRGLGKSELTIDPETGWIKHGTSKQQMKGELNVNAQGNSMTIPMEINTDTEITAIEIPE